MADQGSSRDRRRQLDRKIELSDLGLLETQDVESFGDRAVLVIALSD
jgi:hypothetical protein